MALVGRHVRGTLGVVVDRVPADLLGTMSADDIHSCPDANQVGADLDLHDDTFQPYQVVRMALLDVHSENQAFRLVRMN
jgi:hypothetical protein